MVAAGASEPPRRCGRCPDETNFAGSAASDGYPGDPWAVDDEQIRLLLRPLLDLLDLAGEGVLHVGRRANPTTATAARLLLLLDPDGVWLADDPTTSPKRSVINIQMIAVRLGLVRVVGRRVMLRGKGRRCLDDARALWDRLVAALPLETDEHSRDAARFLLVLTAAGGFGGGLAADERLDHLMRSRGWIFDQDGPSVRAMHAAPLTSTALRMAGYAGALSRAQGRLPKELLDSDGAALLASAALGNEALLR